MAFFGSKGCMMDASLALTPGLGPVIERLDLGDNYYWAVDHLQSIISKLIRETGARRIMELGGGRMPLFSPQEFKAIGVDYIVNDISDHELSLLPPDYTRARFNCCNPEEIPAGIEGQVDLIFSRMLIEHLPSTLEMHRTISRVLRPGGVALHFHPLRYGLPFIANQLLPERVSRPILVHFFPARADSKFPKFPAFYDHCIATDKNAEEIKKTGFSDVKIVPFYDHYYFNEIPGLKQLDKAWNGLARALDWRLFATYAYTLTRK